MISCVAEHDILQRDLPAHRVDLSLSDVMTISEEEAHSHNDNHGAQNYGENCVARQRYKE